MKKNLLLNIAYCLLLSSLFSCSVNKVKTDNSLKKYFDDNKVDGCFAMLNNVDGEITMYNMALDTPRFTAAGTFDVVNALIALQSGMITNDTMMIGNINMKDAFRKGDIGYFQEVARRTGKDNMRIGLDSVGYGNKNIGNAIDSFWLNNNLKISADEQLGLMKRLYFDQLHFRKSAQQMVRDAMLQEDKTSYKLSYKTAAGNDENGHGIGWVTGWIEENKHVYFFVSLIKSPVAGIPVGADTSIAKGALRELGFFKGRK
jgi:beta-lactamase class D